MKRLTALCGALALLLALTLPAGAESEKVGVQFHNEETMTYDPESLTDKVRVTLNGKEMELDVPAVTRTMDGTDGRTLVPVRPIAEALGATVLWMGENRQVVISSGKDMIVLTLGSAQAVVNGKSQELPGGVPAVVARYGEAERTLVPLRFVSEQLRAKVEWDNSTFTALVTADVPENEPSQRPTVSASSPAAPSAAPSRRPGAGGATSVQPPAASDAPSAVPSAAPSQTPESEPKQPDGMLLRLAADDNAQSVTLYLNAPPRYRVTDLGDRVAIDLLGFLIGSGQDGSITPENPVIRRVRYAQHGDDIHPDYAASTRVVLDLKPGCSYDENVTVTGDANLQAIQVTVRPPETGAVTPTLPEHWDPTAFTVVLDAGHGGSAWGATYEDVMEKDVTLPITLRAAELLGEKGYNVVLTRNQDVYIDLYDRCEVANTVGADIFVSIHANASSSNREFQGIFTYSYPKSVEGEKLAGAIQKAVVGETGSIDRGLLTNDYVVLRETTMPAALLEMGFMSCHDELVMLVQPEYQEKLAQGVAKGVEAYLSTRSGKRGAVQPSPAPKAPGGLTPAG